MELYNFAPPNDHYNYPDSYGLLYNVRYPEGINAGIPINCDVTWEPSDGDSLRPEIWDAVLLSEMLVTDEDVHRELGNLSRDGWPVLRAGKVRAAISKCCSKLPQKMQEKETRLAKEFFEPHPLYTGGYRWLDSVDDWRANPAFPMETKTVLKIRLSVDKALPLILTWCCCTFHYCRDMWVESGEFMPLDINQQEPDLTALPRAPGGIEFGHTKKYIKTLTAKEKREKELAAMTPQERAAVLRREQNQRFIKSLLKKGRLSDEDLSLIDMD